MFSAGRSRCAAAGRTARAAQMNAKRPSLHGPRVRVFMGRKLSEYLTIRIIFTLLLFVSRERFRGEVLDLFKALRLREPPDISFQSPGRRWPLRFRLRPGDCRGR